MAIASERVSDTENTAGRLIAASKVNGTSVYNPAGEKLGSVYDVMIDKISGHAEYAVLSFGGFLGMGSNYYPLLWKMLKYDVAQGGYIVDVDKRRLEGAPSYAANETNTWLDSDWDRRVDQYYGVPGTWNRRP